MLQKNQLNKVKYKWVTSPKVLLTSSYMKSYVQFIIDQKFCFEAGIGYEIKIYRYKYILFMY